MKKLSMGKFFDYFEKYRKPRNILRNIPLLGELFRERIELKTENKTLKMEKEKYKSWVQFLLNKKATNEPHKIATIINYCTTDYKFIEFCIDEVKKFSAQIIVPFSDYFFDGTPENQNLLKKTFETNKDVDFIKFPYDPSKQVQSNQYWVTFSRWVGFTKVDENIEYILYLDADEIIEGEKFLVWLNNFNYRDYNAISLASYWYFRETRMQALKQENQGLLIRKNLINMNLIINEGDRDGIFEKVLGKKVWNVRGLDGKPMIHHYSWVRTKEEMLKKVRTWGHKQERDWEQLIEKEFQREFRRTSRDFVHGYRYRIVKPYIELIDS